MKLSSSSPFDPRRRRTRSNNHNEQLKKYLSFLKLTIILMMFPAAVTRRSVTALAPRIIKKYGTPTTTTIRPLFRTLSSVPLSSSILWASSSSSSSSSYSAATKQRIDGLDARKEFSKLVRKFGTSPEKLEETLTQKLESFDQTTPAGKEKAEYMEWLLSSNTSGKQRPQPRKTATANGAAAPSTRKSTKQQPSVRVVKSPANNNNNKNEKQTFATEVKFADRPDLHVNSKRAITEVMGLTTMTEIQDKTFAAASSGRDVLGRARTGTGKTVAFLLPAIERILQLGNHQNNNNIGILVVSPTRELATQIGDQAEKLVKFHKGMSVQVMFGGTNMKRDISRLSKKLPTILVATPGRLLDHMQSTRINGDVQFGRDIMSQTPLVVLDETDRLLDMGFRREIQKILSFLPPSKERQTLLFSATIPPDLKVIMAQNMNKNYIEVDCINDGDAASHTNAQVEQSHVIVPTASARSVSSVVEVVRLALDKYDSPETPAKIVVFFTTARLVNFFAELFNEANIVSPTPVWELHSKKSQGYRNRVSDEFRKAKRGVLFTSDVSARGVDYPNVSHVIQFGMPESREQYIHRLGRTGRGGTAGIGWLVLSEWESLFLQELKGVEIPVDESLSEMINSPISPESKELVDEVRRRVRGGDKVLAKSASGAYQAFLGYYLGQMKRMRMRRKEDLVGVANDFASLSGFYEPPTLNKRLVAKMGLKGIAGINISAAEEPRPQRGGGGRGGGGGGGRRQPSHGHNDGRRAPPKSNAGRRRR